MRPERQTATGSENARLIRVETAPEIRDPASQAVNELAMDLESAFEEMLESPALESNSARPKLVEIKKKLRTLTRAERALIAGDYSEAWFLATVGLKVPAGVLGEESKPTIVP